MHLLALLLVTVLAATPPSSPGDPSQVASVKEAQAAWIDALVKHDQAAFERAVDVDAVFFLPGLSQGRDAVLKSWVIFLVPSNATMSLSPGDAVVSASQDLAYTTGTYVFSAQNNGQVTTVMSGTYLAVWRLAAEGRWMLKAFAGAGERPAASPPVSSGGGTASGLRAAVTRASLANGGGLGPYRFGVPLEEVRKVDACKPYMDVRVTGGLECPNYTFEGRKMNISFIFTSNALQRIQLWVYEGESERDARKAVDFSIDVLKRTAGGVHAYGVTQNDELSGESIIGALKKEQVPAGRGVVVDLQTPSSDSPERWYSRISRRPTGNGDWYGVFLFVEARLPAAAR